MSISNNHVEIANNAAQILGVGGFLENHRHHIVSKLIEFDKTVRAQNQGDGAFIAQSIPLINAIINIGSSTEQYRATLKYIKEAWGGNEGDIDDPDAISILSGLIFLYLVEFEKKEIAKELCTLHEKNKKYNSDGISQEIKLVEDKKNIWDIVNKRIEILFE